MLQDHDHTLLAAATDRDTSDGDESGTLDNPLTRTTVHTHIHSIKTTINKQATAMSTMNNDEGTEDDTEGDDYFRETEPQTLPVFAHSR